MRLFFACCWLVAIAIAMLTPGTKLPEVDLFDFQDKVVHLLVFFVQGYLWSGVGVDKGQASIKNPRILWNFVLFGIAIGIVLESLQQFIPFRSFDMIDMIVNGVGASLGLLAYLKWPSIKYILE
ncbi:VanZ family protein [Algoriphagus sp. H41]|uniref:VanZ family protein n=1 Tax=Algoriphagus oliviformis TaxID=2811231 RepID=A0ABS3C645_9BACT|nr:VanZ family protein [Algoriphagus oliviformis]MBN7811621.1 VanZ family protein [Algoriphagus oliviformis]